MYYSKHYINIIMVSKNLLIMVLYMKGFYIKIIYIGFELQEEILEVLNNMNIEHQGQ